VPIGIAVQLLSTNLANIQSKRQQTYLVSLQIAQRSIGKPMEILKECSTHTAGQFARHMPKLLKHDSATPINSNRATNAL
jgi:hypothetical protein